MIHHGKYYLPIVTCSPNKILVNLKMLTGFTFIRNIWTDTKMCFCNNQTVGKTDRTASPLFAVFRDNKSSVGRDDPIKILVRDNTPIFDDLAQSPEF